MLVYCTSPLKKLKLGDAKINIVISTRDGFIPFKGFKIYYKIASDHIEKNKLPILILAGGPGSTHNYLLDLQHLAKNGRVVIFYDQLGSGKSDHPDNKALWKIDLFVQEINTIRESLGLSNIHLLGHSWGGMLAIEYLATKPSGVRSLTLASTMISMPLFKREMTKLRKQLPGKVNQILAKHEKAGTVDYPEYKAAYSIFSKKHMFRGGEWPLHLDAPVGSFNKQAYETMWGLSETYPNGTLSKWDRTKHLRKITIPTLITSGRYDELTPKQAIMTKKQIPNSKQFIFEYSGHMPHVDESGAYLKALENFLEEVERTSPVLPHAN